MRDVRMVYLRLKLVLLPNDPKKVLDELKDCILI